MTSIAKLFLILFIGIFAALSIAPEALADLPSNTGQLDLSNEIDRQYAAEAIFCDAQRLVRSNLGVTIGLLISAAGLLILILGQNKAGGILFMLVGVFLTALPGLFISILEGTQAIFEPLTLTETEQAQNMGVTDPRNLAEVRDKMETCVGAQAQDNRFGNNGRNRGAGNGNTGGTSPTKGDGTGLTTPGEAGLQGSTGKPQLDPTTFNQMNQNINNQIAQGTGGTRGGSSGRGSSGSSFGGGGKPGAGGSGSGGGANGEKPRDNGKDNDDEDKEQSIEERIAEQEEFYSENPFIDSRGVVAINASIMREAGNMLISDIAAFAAAGQISAEDAQNLTQYVQDAIDNNTSNTEAGLEQLSATISVLEENFADYVSPFERLNIEGDVDNVTRGGLGSAAFGVATGGGVSSLASPVITAVGGTNENQAQAARLNGLINVEPDSNLSPTARHYTASALDAVRATKEFLETGQTPAGTAAQYVPILGSLVRTTQASETRNKTAYAFTSVVEHYANTHHVEGFTVSRLSNNTTRYCMPDRCLDIEDTKNDRY